MGIFSCANDYRSGADECNRPVEQGKVVHGWAHANRLGDSL